MRVTTLIHFLRHVQIRTFQKGDVLISEGSSNRDLFFVRKGLIRSFKKAKHFDQEEITFQLFPENSVSGNIHTIFLMEASSFTYEAIERTKVYWMDFDSFNEVSKVPELGEFNRMFMGKRLVKQAFQRIESFVFLSPEERYIRYIKDHPNVINRAPDKYIANILGITPTSLSRIRKRIATKI